MKRRSYPTIHSRLFVLLLICMAGIVTVVSFLFYNRTTEQIQEKIKDLAQKNVSQTTGLFDLLQKGYDSMSKSIINNVDLVHLLSVEPTDPSVAFVNERAIINALGAVFYSRNDLIGIHILTDNGKVYNYGNYMSEYDQDYAKTSWYRQVKHSSGQMVWLGVYAHSIIDKTEDRSVFAFGRQIYDLNEHKLLGVILYESDPQPIMSALENLKLSANSKVYLVNENNDLISSTTGEPGLPLLAEVPHPQQAGDLSLHNQAGHLVVSSRLPFADWTVISVTPEKDLDVELVEMKRYLIIVGVILILVSTIIASVISRMIAAPLKRLIQEMKQVEMGNLKGMTRASSYQEFNVLAMSFNQMLIRIGELIERVKISSVSEKNAELHALQSQVNPHFLYNTLDMIYWMLDEKGEDDLAEVVLSLSNMFRYSSRWEDGPEVKLREEIAQIGHYLTIISNRLEGRVTVEMEIDERWMDIPVPKMVLQPIIENAVKHGLEPLGRPGVLKIYAEKEAINILRIMIVDNGIGMDENIMLEVQGSMSEGKTLPGNGIGLANVHKRLQHLFGSGYGVSINSHQGIGTTVVVRIPILHVLKDERSVQDQ